MEVTRYVQIALDSRSTSVLYVFDLAIFLMAFCVPLKGGTRQVRYVTLLEYLMVTSPSVNSLYVNQRKYEVSVVASACSGCFFFFGFCLGRPQLENMESLVTNFNDVRVQHDHYRLKVEDLATKVIPNFFGCSIIYVYICIYTERDHVWV